MKTFPSCAQGARRHQSCRVCSSGSAGARTGNAFAGGEVASPTASPSRHGAAFSTGLPRQICCFAKRERALEGGTCREGSWRGTERLQVPVPGPLHSSQPLVLVRGPRTPPAHGGRHGPTQTHGVAQACALAHELAADPALAPWGRAGAGQGPCRGVAPTAPRARPVLKIPGLCLPGRSRGPIAAFSVSELLSLRARFGAAPRFRGQELNKANASARQRPGCGVRQGCGGGSAAP